MELIKGKKYQFNITDNRIRVLTFLRESDDSYFFYSSGTSNVIKYDKNKIYNIAKID